jgi:DNA topoisomerase VI subunit A
MAKKTKPRDTVTLKKIHDLADDVAKKSLGGREPKLDIPMRTKSNTIWNKKQGILQMGAGTTERELDRA